MVFGSVFEVSFRASAVFCAFWIESIGVIGSRWRSMVVVECFNDCSVLSGG